METFGSRLRKLRRSKGLTIEQLAELCDSSESVIRGYEKSRCMPSCQTLIRLCNTLEVAPDYLLQDELKLETLTERKAFFLKINSLPQKKYKAICAVMDSWEE